VDHTHVHPAAGARDRSSLQVADIVRAHAEGFLSAHPAVSDHQRRVLRAIARCRTSALGGHLDECPDCGWSRPSYNSCRDRHCPSCQSLDQARWIAARMERVLPTHCFHVVFTLPKGLRALAQANQELVYDLLFEAASASLLELGHDPRFIGGLIGVTAVLHTWTREQLYHPHLHCVVTGGALSADPWRWIDAPKNFLFPVRVLGQIFRGKFMDALVRAHAAGKLDLTGSAAALADAARFARLRRKLYTTRWVVYCKRPFGGPEHVFKYLGRYTHRVGISNQRLVSHDDHGVTFRTRGSDIVTLHPHEFLRRFLLHVLPPHFVKKRHYGLFAPSNIARAWVIASLLVEQRRLPPDRPLAPERVADDFQALFLAFTGIDLGRCPRCGGPVTRRPLTAHARPTAHDTS